MSAGDKEKWHLLGTMNLPRSATRDEWNQIGKIDERTGLVCSFVEYDEKQDAWVPGYPRQVPVALGGKGIR
jgi:hypothetical protein